MIFLIYFVRFLVDLGPHLGATWPPTGGLLGRMRGACGRLSYPILPKTSPRPLQDPLKTPQRPSKTPQRPSKMAQDGLKMVPKWPKMVLRWPKMVLRWSQHGSIKVGVSPLLAQLEPSKT